MASGAALASLRKTDYQQKIAEAKASLAQAYSTYREAKLDASRDSKLAAAGSLPGATADTSRSRRDSASAVVQGAEARLSEAKTALADSTLVAPMTGVVLKRSIEVGTLAAPGTVAFTIADVTSVKAVFGVPDSFLSQIRIGATQKVTTDAFPGIEFEGKVSRFAPSADQRSHVFEVDVTIPNPDNKLKAGMVASLSISPAAGTSADVPLVPLNAIVRPPSGKGFAILRRGDRARADTRACARGPARRIPRSSRPGHGRSQRHGVGRRHGCGVIVRRGARRGHSVSSRHDDEAESDRRIVAKTKNTARYFTENGQVAWAAMLLTLAGGVFGYLRMPKAKDPQLDIRVAVATCAWPGEAAEKVEQLITRKIEQKLGDATNLEKIESISRTGISIVYVTLRESITDRTKELSDIQGRLDAIHDLPAGACRLANGQTGPIQFQKDFGDTATLMLTIASPRANDIELDLRADAIAHAIETARRGAGTGRTSLVLNFPPDSEPHVLERLAGAARDYFGTLTGVSDARLLQGPGFLGLDVATTRSDRELGAQLRAFASEHLRLSELHPDVWPLVMIQDPKQARARLADGAGDRYTYHELDQFTELVQRYLQRLPIVSRVTRAGVVPEQIYLEYSQDRLASYDLDLSKIGRVLAGRNTTAAGGVIEVSGKNVTIDPAGELASTKDIADMAVTTNANGSPTYLRDLVDISREYASPARFLNFLTMHDASGQMVTHRAITLAINMRVGSQISDFAVDVDRELATISRLLPEDLILRRTSDQPLQVEENVELFMHSLYEAIGLVVLVALIGFWEWRSALLLALSIPITLAMTFGLMYAWGSISSRSRSPLSSSRSGYWSTIRWSRAMRSSTPSQRAGSRGSRRGSDRPSWPRRSCSRR